MFVLVKKSGRLSFIFDDLGTKFYDLLQGGALQIYLLYLYFTLFFIARDIYVIPNIFTDPSFDAIIHMTANRNETVVGQGSGQLDQKVVGSPDRTSLD